MRRRRVRDHQPHAVLLCQLFPQIIQIQTYTVAGASITNVQIAILALCVAVMAGLALLVYRTRLGTAMRATGDNPQMVRALGGRERVAARGSTGC